MADLIQATDTLNQGREKINAILELANGAIADVDVAITTINGAIADAQEALNNSNTTQDQLDSIILASGTSDAETIQARGTFPLLYNRLNDIDLHFETIGKISVMDGRFNVVGDGVTDDTVEINAVVQYAKTNKIQEIYFPEATYLIDGFGTPAYNYHNGGIKIDFPVIITLHPDAIIKQKPTSQNGYNIFTISYADRITIQGGTLMGDLAEHLGTTGEMGFGIYGRGSTNITIKNVKFSNFWGDSIMFDCTTDYIYNENITIENCIIDGSRRNGIAVGHFKNVYIINNDIINTGSVNGTPPKAGIDVEGSSVGHVGNNINIIGNRFSGNITTDIGFSMDTHGINIKNNIHTIKARAVNISPLTSTITNAMISGNHYIGTSTAVNAINITSVAGNGLSVTDNYFKDLNGNSDSVGVNIGTPMVNAIISNNRFSNCGYGILLNSDAIGIVVVSNSFKNILTTAIRCNGSVLTSCKINDNDIDTCGKYGIDSRQNKGSISENSIRSTQKSGINLSITTETTLSNNQIYNFCLDGLDNTSNAGIFSYNSSSFKNFITGNYLASSATTHDAIRITATPAASHTIISNNVARSKASAIYADTNCISSNNFTV